MRLLLRAVVLPLVIAGCKPPHWFDIDTDSTTSSSSGSGEVGSSSSGSSSGGDESGSEGSDSVGMSTGSSGSDTTGSSDTTGTSGPATTGPVEACGDGVIQEGEECDDFNLEPDDGCDEHCFRDRVVFTTSVEFPGDLNGIKGALGYCRTLAAQGGIPRDETFEPWLSDSKTDAIEHVHQGKGRYLRPDGVVVANSFDDFLAGALLAPLDIDEHGNPIGGSEVWTGTRLDGTKMPGKSHCNDWFGVDNPLALEAWVGSSTSTDMFWTINEDPELGLRNCAPKFRLYCFEGE